MMEGDWTRAPFVPQPVDLPWSAVPSTVETTAADAERAQALWDYVMGQGDTEQYVGLLDAEPE